MKIIIAGCGKVGIALAGQLAAEKHDITVIDRQQEIIDKVVNLYDVMGVTGNCANYDVLTEAGVKGADLLIATTSSDEINIIACLVAKKAGVLHTIARVRNPEYEKQLRFMRAELGLTLGINPEKETAREIARALRFLGATKVEPFSKGRLELIEYRLPAGSKLAGMKLADLNKTFRSRVLICAVMREGEVTIPSGETRLREGDYIYMTASPHDLEDFFRALGIFKGRASSVMIVGASKTCYYLAKTLLDTGISVKIVEQNEAVAQEFCERLPRALVITGDGTDPDLLREEGLNEVDAFVAITGIDEANILMAINVSHNANCKVMAKVNRKALRDLILTTGMVDGIVSPGEITTERVLHYVRSMQNADGMSAKALHRLVSDKVNALEFSVSDDLAILGIPLKNLKLRPGILIAGIVRQNGDIVIPSGTDTLEAGDDIIIVTTLTSLNDLREIIA